jgi:hypothetical protein
MKFQSRYLIVVLLLALCSIPLRSWAQQGPTHENSTEQPTAADQENTSRKPIDPAQTSNFRQPPEQPCRFSPAESTNSINAPCYAIVTAVATDNQGAQTISAPVLVHFKKPKPTPTPCARKCDN